MKHQFNNRFDSYYVAVEHVPSAKDGEIFVTTGSYNQSTTCCLSIVVAKELHKVLGDILNDKN